MSRLSTKQRRARSRGLHGGDKVVTVQMVRDAIRALFEGAAQPWRPVPVGRCPRCGALWYTLTGFCGGCR